MNAVSFTEDWVSGHLQNWRAWTSGRNVRDVLEIGSYEGRSAVAWADLFHGAHLTCVDLFDSSYEGRFDQNTDRIGVDKRKGSSRVVLPLLALEGHEYDLIYVDGDHSADGTYADAALAWPMLRKGGVMIFDDYEWMLGLPPLERPKHGVDTFIARYADHCRVLGTGWQVCIEKL